MCKNNKMLAAKVEETAIISLWHYFCTLEASYSVYLTGNYNIYPILQLLLNRSKRVQPTTHNFIGLNIDKI